MTYIIMLFVTRSHTITSEQFRDHYEYRHIPLVHSLLRHCWPISFKRRYIARISRAGFGGPANPDRPPLMLRGEMNELDCDCVSEVTFQDEAHFHTFYRNIYAKENAAIITRDEENFLEQGKTRIIVIGESWCTDEFGKTTRDVGHGITSEREESEGSSSGRS